MSFSNASMSPSEPKSIEGINLCPFNLDESQKSKIETRGKLPYAIQMLFINSKSMQSFNPASFSFFVKTDDRSHKTASPSK